MPKSRRTRNTSLKLNSLVIEKSKENKKTGNSFKPSTKKATEPKINAFTLFSPTTKKHEKTKKQHTNYIKNLMKDIGIDNMTCEQYIPSSVDKPDLVLVKQVDLLKDYEGRGLFAREDIPSGTTIAIYTGDVYSSVQAFDGFLEDNPESNNNYAMKINGKIVDAATKGNFSRYINFSDTQDNVEFVERVLNGQKVVKVIATRDIRAEQQFLVNYNTYEENASKCYSFLNPGDGALSASELHEANAEHYQLLMEMHINIDLFNLVKKDCLYASSIGKAILENNLLSKVKEMPSLDEIDLPFLKVNSSYAILDFDDADAFTPLMLAAYFGQLANVKWLVNYQANVDQQQNHSGNCPLFCALAGYADADTARKETNYFKIIQHLIENKANIFVHDRADKTFVHKSSSVLSNKDFRAMMNLIKKQENIYFGSLFSHIDENDFDIVLYCLQNKLFDKAQILLDVYPEYFITNYYGREKELYNKDILTKIIESYDEDEKETLLEILDNITLKVPKVILTGLSRSEESSCDEENGFNI